MKTEKILRPEAPKELEEIANAKIEELEDNDNDNFLIITIYPGRSERYDKS